jgi:hypothetical protein
VWSDKAARRTSLILLAVLLVAVVAAVVAMNRPTWANQSVQEVSGTSGGRTLTVRVGPHEECGGEPRVHVMEDAQAVTLRADYDESGNCDSVALESAVEVKLDEPLGSRTLVVEHASLSLVCSVDGSSSDSCRAA